MSRVTGAKGFLLFSVSPRSPWKHLLLSDFTAPQPAPESAEGLLDRADTLKRNRCRCPALYARAQHLFDAQTPKALYAEVSQVPPDESKCCGQDLPTDPRPGRPAAQEVEQGSVFHNPGMLETNYDADRHGPEEVKSLALKQRRSNLLTS
jgi:hypothetical protein